MDPNNWYDGYFAGQRGELFPSDLSVYSEAHAGWNAGTDERRLTERRAAKATAREAPVATRPSIQSASLPFARQQGKPLGPLAYGLLGAAFGVFVALLVRMLQHGAFFGILYPLCFAVAFGSLSFAAKQLFRRRWISAAAALLVGYALPQFLLPGFSLFGILRAYL